MDHYGVSSIISPPLLLIYAYGQPNSTHSQFFLSLLIFAMGRCCSLSSRSTCRNPRPTAPTATVLPYTYSTPYSMLAFIYNIYTAQKNVRNNFVSGYGM